MSTMLTEQSVFCNNHAENYQIVTHGGQFFPMDIKEIRRVNLQKLIDERFDGFAARLASKLDMKPPQLHRWRSGGQGMSEDSARAIEQTLSLPPLSLDLPAGHHYATAILATAPSSPAVTAAEQTLLDDWRLLLHEDQERFSRQIRQLADIGRAYQARFGAGQANADRVNAALPAAPHSPNQEAAQGIVEGLAESRQEHLARLEARLDALVEKMKLSQIEEPDLPKVLKLRRLRMELEELENIWPPSHQGAYPPAVDPYAASTKSA
jgi:hypothetical protein